MTSAALYSASPSKLRLAQAAAENAAVQFQPVDQLGDATIRSRRVETLRHQAPSKLEESSASRPQPRSNARQDALTKKTQNTVLSDVSACGCTLQWVLETSFNSVENKAVRFCPTFDDWSHSHMRLAHLSFRGTLLSLFHLPLSSLTTTWNQRT